jgi:hypothetical protein
MSRWRGKWVGWNVGLRGRLRRGRASPEVSFLPWKGREEPPRGEALGELTELFHSIQHEPLDPPLRQHSMREPTRPRLIIGRPLCPANPSSLLRLPVRYFIDVSSFFHETFSETEGLEDFDRAEERGWERRMSAEQLRKRGQRVTHRHCTPSA